MTPTSPFTASIAFSRIQRSTRTSSGVLPFHDVDAPAPRRRAEALRVRDRGQSHGCGCEVLRALAVGHPALLAGRAVHHRAVLDGRDLVGVLVEDLGTTTGDGLHRDREPGLLDRG